MPVSMAQLDDKPLLLITSSGGLGSEDVLERISGLYQGRAEEGEGLRSLAEYDITARFFAGF